MIDGMTPSQFHAAEGAGDWRILGDGATAFFRTGSFSGGARFAAAIGTLPDVDSHPPDVDVRADGVTVRLVTFTDQYAGMTRRDLELARGISRLARELGLVADPSAVQSLLIIPGAPVRAEIFPFWQAILGYQPRVDSPDQDLVDPRGRGVPFWLAQFQKPRPDGAGATHVAVWVPPEQAEARLAAALAAGGRLIRDEFAPSWWTLADPAGNVCDISTILGRD